MSPRRVLAYACIALLSCTLSAQTPAPQNPQDDEFLKGTYRPGAGVTSPAVLREVKATYTQEAMRQKIAGEVELQAVVGIDGSVERARVVRSLDREYGLDAAALQAASQWKFRPGTISGTPVPVVVTLLLEFKLHSCGPSGCASDGFVPPSLPLAARQNEASAVRRAFEEDEFLKGTYPPGASGVGFPSVVREVKPSYTAEAMRQKLQGSVEVQVVVGIDGSVERARVTKSLDAAFGLDATALESAKQWRFKPATLNGQPVPVVVLLLLDFRLSK